MTLTVSILGHHERLLRAYGQLAGVKKVQPIACSGGGAGETNHRF